MEWYQYPVQDIWKAMESRPEGLDETAVQERLEQYGPNRLQEAKRKSVLAMVLGQFKDFMIIVLLAAAFISGILGDIADTIAIVLIVLLNAILGFVQEYRAEKAMQALRHLAVAHCRVLRGGRVADISADNLVPGDVVLLEAGDVVPADLRLVVANALKIEEASLTGESVPSDKATEPLPEDNLPLGDRSNMAFKSTHVTFGKGRGVVIATGMQTELGRIASLLEVPEVQTPLQKRLAELGRKLAFLVLVICVVVFLFGLWRGEQPITMLLTAISLAVAAIPEALPSLVSISLAIGARRMARKKALVRNLPAVETLGSVTYICTDKTGTLTENKMTVEMIFADERVLDKNQWAGQTLSAREQDLLIGMALNNNVSIGKDNEVNGDPTEVALYRMAHSVGFDKENLEQQFLPVAEIPFDSDRKCMTTIHKDGNGYRVLTKGAADVLLQQAKTGSGLEGFSQEYEKLLGNGLRVLGFAQKFLDELPVKIDPASIEKDLAFIGLAGIIDPPREEVKAAIAECTGAGIRPVMITGDHPLTAHNIGERLGMVGPGAAVLTGTDLSGMSSEELKQKVPQVQIYARVSPEQKLHIVSALQANNQFVAMTGDGVNDAPSLKRSDIGVAMGITGTEVSKEAADLILLDDNYATIVKAVRSGRRIYDNIRKFIKYAMTGNTGEIWLIFLAPFFNLPIPLLPIHILWINLVTDGLPGLALAAEPAEHNIMQRPPRHPKESVFAGGMGYHIIWVGLLLGSVSIATQALFIHQDNWQTMVFTVLCFSQMGHVFAIRSDYASLFKQGLFSNAPLFWAVMFTLGLQLAVIYVPFLQPVFHTRPLSLKELGIAFALSSIVFFAVEIEKALRRARNK
ncbi:Ca2+-transporting ATPase [Cnuella takakiae]|uniref:Ca2+-transporting ATPase n=1 Tax=Cnuella takakiae TaxID=1302690 RepID=A0A1M5GFC6_9BACT|nr:cation-translocating P-type ATPase [Cnuella takakiae]OLY92399.1 ATPase [Cnuella takakiae]SHG02398.1 Ca2+-transporting ATPase [Cnuella takakiae]